jgi:gas vesicle protein
MTEEQATPSTKEPTSPTADAWREVGKQFEALGNSLANAFRTAWQDEHTRRHMHEMQTGLETMVNEIGDAIKETSESPEGHKARVEAERAAQSLRAAGQKTWQEAKPQLVTALRQLNAELQKTITRLEEEAQASAAETASSKKE